MFSMLILKVESRSHLEHVQKAIVPIALILHYECQYAIQPSYHPSSLKLPSPFMFNKPLEQYCYYFYSRQEILS
jgi:hypothetical protein